MDVVDAVNVYVNENVIAGVDGNADVDALKF